MFAFAKYSLLVVQSTLRFFFENRKVRIAYATMLWKELELENSICSALFKKCHFKVIKSIIIPFDSRFIFSVLVYFYQLTHVFVFKSALFTIIISIFKVFH